MAHDPRKLTPHVLTAIERDAEDYARKLKDPRRIVRRLLDHIDAVSEESLTLPHPGKDK